MARRRSQKGKKERSLSRALLVVFHKVRKTASFKSAPVSELKSKMLDALIVAAFARCVEFNIIANRRGAGDGFVLVSGLRGVCEDLIVLSYLSRLPPSQSAELVPLLMGQSTTKAIAAQRNFFAANNPMQPVLGGGLKPEEVAARVTASRDSLRAFWKKVAETKRDGPTIRDMAEVVGLSSTYEYIYFAASNFVHFNPQALMRMGWGPEMGPFEFSITHMEGYYRNLASFYGAILFIGFYASFGDRFIGADLSFAVDRLLELIEHVQRWPEIVTFEEMNERPPLYLLTHALGKVMRDEDKSAPYGAILTEVRNLRLR